MRTSNPAIKDDMFARARAAAGNPTETMTVSDTINKIGILLLIAVSTASWSWDKTLAAASQAAEPGLAGASTFMGAGIVGFILAIATVFKPTWSPYTAPLYAAVEGVFLGAISAFFEMRYPGIAMQAAFGTMATLGAMLFCYKTGIIRATEKFKTGVFAATGGIMGLYVISWILGMFGVEIPMIHGGGMMGIGFSLFVVGLAALNLILDFDHIEAGERAGAPKFMEWYGAFTIMITLVWLYMEMLRLLAKLKEE